MQNYLNMCKIMGMQASQLFESSDLVNGKFKTSILINLKTLQGIYERYGRNAPKTDSSTGSTSSAPSSTSGTSSATNNTVQPTLASQKSISTPTSSIPISTNGSSSATSTSTPTTSSSMAPTHQTKTSAPEPDVVRNSVAIKPEDRTVALIQRWVEVLLTMRCPAGKTLFDWLKPGVILLRVLNAVRPGLAKQIYDGSIGYKQIENVQRYLKLCPMASSPAVPLFAVADLTDEMNLSAVVSHLHAMITIIQRDPKWTGPTLESVSHSVGSDSSDASPSHEAAPSSSAPTIETATSSAAPSSSSSASSTASSSATSSTSSAHMSREAAAAVATANTAAETIERLKQTLAREAEAERARFEQEALDQANLLRENQRQENLQEAVEVREQMQAAIRRERELLRREQEDLEELMFQTRKDAAALKAERQRDELRALEKAAEVEASEKRLHELALQNAAAEAQKEADKAAAQAAREHERRTSESDEIDRVRKQMEAERVAMAEERRVFAERMQEETERRLKEMALKMEQETAAVISRERSKSQAISEKLTQERQERERVAQQLEEERRDRLVLLERQKVDLTLTAQKQMQAVADRLQEETTKRLEAMASKITSEAMHKAEQELRRKDEHLMKQLERERKLRSRLDALEEEKKSLSRTFEKKFASLETELKTVKTRTNSNSITSPTLAASNGASSAAPSAHVDPETLDEFRAWNNRWRINRKLTKQLTRTLTEIESNIGNGEINLQLNLDTDDERPLDLITPRSDASEDLSARESTSHSEIETSTSPNYTQPQHSITSHTEASHEDDTDTERKGADDEDSLDLEGKGWLDDDWSEEEDWESERSDFDDEDDEDATSPKKRDGADSEASESPRPVSSKNKTSSPLKDDWSELSSVKLSRYA